MLPGTQPANAEPNLSAPRTAATLRPSIPHPMRPIQDSDELQRLHAAGQGLIYNDFTPTGKSASQYNILHTAGCAWIRRSNLGVPKVWFADLEEARGWLNANRGPEGVGWKRCGTCGAGSLAPGRGSPLPAPPAKSRAPNPPVVVTPAEVRAAEALFLDGLEWLREHYTEFPFMQERDLVWTLQSRLVQAARPTGLQVFNDYRLGGSTRADLAITNGAGVVLLVAEFKYEPSHRRSEIPARKFPVCFWTGEGSGAKDVLKVQGYVAAGCAAVAYAVFIDEGGFFRQQAPPSGSVWHAWGNGVWVLQTRAQG